MIWRVLVYLWLVLASVGFVLYLGWLMHGSLT